MTPWMFPYLVASAPICVRCSLLAPRKHLVLRYCISGMQSIWLFCMVKFVFEFMSLNASDILETQPSWRWFCGSEGPPTCALPGVVIVNHLL
jgi:hypothetical protein